MTGITNTSESNAICRTENHKNGIYCNNDTQEHKTTMLAVTVHQIIFLTIQINKKCEANSHRKQTTSPAMYVMHPGPLERTG